MSAASFERGTTVSEDNWHRVAAKADVATEEPIRVQVGEEDIAIYNLDGDLHATSNICTHAYASMVDGFQEGDEIECPLHEGRFSIKTGEALCAPVTDALKVFEVKVEGDDILVKV
jgi:nitrite reductase/ring-hydroxylating ferredoxin subunit